MISKNQILKLQLMKENISYISSSIILFDQKKVSYGFEILIWNFALGLKETPSSKKRRG